jgi:capsular polysaccharide biosynthesis protein
MSEPENFSIHAVQKKRGQDEPAKPVVPVMPALAGPRPQPAAQSPIRPAAATPAAPAAEPTATLPFDLLRLISALLRNWYWMLISGGILSVLMFAVGYFKFETGYWVTVQLIRRESTTPIRASLLGDAFKPRQVSVQTIVDVMQSPKLLDRVGSLANPPMTGAALNRALTIKPEKETDLITVTVKDKLGIQATADLANLYSREVVAMTAQMQSEEAAELDKFLQEQISRIDSELDAINQELLQFSRDNEFYGDDREVEAYLKQQADTELAMQTATNELDNVNFRIASTEHELAQQDPVAIKLNMARSELATVRSTYADSSPFVKSAQAKLDAIQQEIKAAGGLKTNFDSNFQYSDNTLANDLYMQLVSLRGEREGLNKQLVALAAFDAQILEKLRGVPAKSQHHAQIVARQQSLQATRDLFSGRQHEAQIYEENSPGLYRQFAPATEDSVETSNRWIKIIIATVVAFILGILGTIGVVLGRELMDLRIISGGDLRRITEVPVIARLPELESLSETQLAQWRFRTWAHVIRQLKLQNETRFTLAFTSTRPGEGKSTFIKELYVAARDRRLPVVMVINSSLPEGQSKRIELAAALATPELVCQHVLSTPEVPLELHFASDWQWTLENRNRWERAARLWNQLEAMALFVELPPMTDLDAVLAAELMPITIWVAMSGGLQQRDLAESLEMVEAGEVRLAAAMLNQEPPALAKLAFLGKFGLPV